ncbi:MAG: prepilin peptidase, partial [Acidobacteriota bacterium]|nr:prepilin peptidase [Acidobacteriota bacterium]
MSLETPLVVLTAVFGLAIGSFLNVVIHRLPRGQSLLAPPSTCPSCGTRLRA